MRRKKAAKSTRAQSEAIRTEERARIKAALQAELWDMLADAVEDNDGWPEDFSQLVSRTHLSMEIVDSNTTFMERFSDLFREERAPKPFAFSLSLSPTDRRKILANLDEQCLSDETKEQIRTALRNRSKEPTP